MATDIGGSLKNSVDGYVAQGVDLKGVYAVVKTVAERDAIPSTNIVAGSLIYVSDDSKAYRYDGSSWSEEAGGIGSVSSVNNVSAVSGNITVDSKHIKYDGDSSDYLGVFTTKNETILWLLLGAINCDLPNATTTIYGSSDGGVTWQLASTYGLTFKKTRVDSSGSFLIMQDSEGNEYSYQKSKEISNYSESVYDMLNKTGDMQTSKLEYNSSNQISGYAGSAFATGGESVNYSATSGITLNNNLFRLSLTTAQLDNNYYYGYNPKNDNWTPVVTSATLGALSELKTTNKTSIVNSINSVYTATTANKSSITAINTAMGDQVTYSLSGTTLTITSK